MINAKTASIRTLNDKLRRELIGGRVMVTPGITAEGGDFLRAVLVAISQFADFNPDNDPYDEHDFGAVDVCGQRVFWKIDYYNADLMTGCDRPEDPLRCTRVMTIMLAEEY